MTERGVVFPELESGRRSTTATGKAIVAEAMRAVDEAGSARVSAESNWRKRYPQYFEQLTAQAMASADHANDMAAAGLAAVHSTFQFAGEGEAVSLSDAMSIPTERRFETAVLTGGADRRPLTVLHQNRHLTGVNLLGQLAQWRERGIIEGSHAEAVTRVLENPEWVSELPPIVLLGAGAEMGPFATLLELGATVIAVDLNRSSIWGPLLAAARRSAGTLIFPLAKPQTDDMSDQELTELAGANLLTDAAEISRWLIELDRPLVLGGYAYRDGSGFVRVSVAMDAIMAEVSQRNAHPVQLAFLLTPTDVYAVPEAVAAASRERYEASSGVRSVRSLLRSVSGSRLFAPNVRQMVSGENGKRYGIINSLITQQGPNYTLAKRIQRWRSLVARAEGQLVSCNVAPATYTQSVTKNRLFAAGFAGAQVFGTEAFEPTTSNALMTAQLVADLLDPQSPSRPDAAFDNPEELFMDGASHSGFWRMGSQLSSVIEAAVVAGAFKQLRRRGQVRG
ncbi:MAG: hypothetical protein AAF358_18260 [Pseudomonadota bacterium]